MPKTEVLLFLEKIIDGVQDVFVVGTSSTIREAYQMILQTEPDYDYILKPADENRVLRAIMYLQKQKEQESSDRFFEKAEMPYRIAIKKEKEISLIDPKKIIFLEKAGKKVTIHCSESEYELIDTLERLGKKLSQYFFRSHKSYLINVSYIQKIVPWNKNTYQIHFKNTTKQAPLSRRKLNELLEKIEQ